MLPPTFTAGNRYVSLPSDALIIRSVQVIDGGTRVFLEKRDTSFISEFNRVVLKEPQNTLQIGRIMCKQVILF